MFVTPVDRSEVIRLLDGWAEIDLLNRAPKGRRLVFQARQNSGDDSVLYSVAVEDERRSGKPRRGDARRRGRKGGS